MPASKSKARLSKPFPLVDLNDEIPSALIEALVALRASDSNNTLREPPSKRAKLSRDDPFPAYLITRQTLSICRRAAETLDLPEPAIRNDVGGHLQLSYVNSQWSSKQLKLSVPSAGTASRAALALRPDSVSQALGACINIHSKESRADEGALWTTVGLRIERQGKNVQIVFDLELYWNATFSPFRLRTPRQRKISQMVLSTFFDDVETTTTTQAAETTWTPLDFYEAAFVPPATDGSALAIEVPGLNASLYPYQKRTLKWLLHREGMRWVPPSNGSAADLKSVEETGTLQPARSFGEIVSPSNVQWYLSHLYHAITPETSAFLSAEKEVRGGILSEEMGLGKTLEIIGLILLHRRQPADEDSYLHANNERLLKSGATLIVCPESLRQQWMDELERHAPHLLVSYYPGRGQFCSQTEEEVFRNMAAHDVIRSRRREREYERPKSPLTQISWWRVCLDEAQMIETGVSAAALVARVLHRVNAWGVTGTPVKKDVQDLLGLLLFLRFEPYCSSPQVWKALTKNHKPLFHDLFHDIAIRHTKKLVRDELELPAQKRFVITLPFTAVEEQYYQSVFAEMAEVCNVDLDGNPMLADWDPKSYEEAMRTYLNRLRQAALHPEVGVQNRRALGHRAGPLRTVDEVLTAMIEQSDASIRTEQRAYFTARLNHGQLLENGPLVKEALVIWDQTRREVEEVVGKCRQELDAAMNAAKRTNSENGSVSNTNGTSDEDVVEGLDEYQASPEVGEALMRLRSALEVQHRAIFFCANARFQIKSNTDFTEPDSAEFSALQKLEEEGYETAKGVRREILSENHRKATKAMRKLGNDAASQNFVTIPELIPNPVKGLESATVVEKVEELYGFLNLQANLIDEWREVIVGLLLQPLVDEENETETTGDEFVNSTAIQEQLMVHVQVLRATIADRQDAISGLQNMLVKHETQTTKALAMDGEGPAPKTLIELLDMRNKVKPSLEEHGCLRGAIGELRALAARLPPHEPGKESRANMEHEVVNRQIKDIQAQIQAQAKASQRLERECDEFTNAMNLRLDYYRQLQAISDSVDVYEGPKTQDILTKWVNAAETAHRKLSSAEAKHRYLVSLREGGASKANEPKMCIICQTDFTIGVLTVCGHQFCKQCLMLWFKAHHNCPMCKRKLKITDLHTITLKPRELTLHTEDAPTSTPGKKRSAARNKSAIYSEFGADKLAQIRDVDLEGPPLTTKKHPIFNDTEIISANSVDCLNRAGADDADLEPSQMFFELLLKKANEQTSIMERIFPEAETSFWELIEKIRDDIILEYSTSLFDAAHQRSLGAYLKAVSGVFEQTMLFFQSLTPPKTSKETIETKAREMTIRVFEPHVDLYLQEELDFFTKHAESEVGTWEKRLSEQDASVESFYMSNINRQVDKTDFLSSFKKVVMMPVSVLPSFQAPFGSGAKPSTATPANGSGLNTPQLSRPETPGVRGSVDGRKSPLPDKAPTDELAAKAALMASRLEGIKSLFSIEVALNLVHAAQTSLGRAAQFIRLKGQYGEEAREQCETIFVVLLRILGTKHVQVGFEKAVGHLSNYNPREVSHHDQSGVAPLVQFIELVNVGDLISQMIDVFYEQQLAGPKIADKNDFLDPAGLAKRKWEQMLDENVAAGLNKGIDVLMDEVEFLHGSTQLPTDYNPQLDAAGGILADPGPTATAQRIVELVSAHTRMLVGSTDKSMLDVFNGEVGLRLFTAVCKHLKRQRVSTAGAIKLIADMNLYFEYIRTLRNQDLLAYFKALRELSQIYLIEPQHAKEMATIIADGDRFGGIFRAEEVYEYAQRRADWYQVKTKVERAMYGMECQLM
ncbi:hypothetical protein BN1723_008762 [Verticillium longisporum]|uniref:RING-type domain-containing protein n=2 Tax=Verticillium longisporum TaxID=100787 RepID=A0A0G4KIN3_VERLO|nr:hypothetical protein BN1723_008762 [Verticillium longisporum]